MTHWRNERQPAGGTADHRSIRDTPRNSLPFQPHQQREAGGYEYADPNPLHSALPYMNPVHGQITQALIDIFTSLFWIAFGLLFLCAVASIPLAVVLMMFF